MKNCSTFNLCKSLIEKFTKGTKQHLIQINYVETNHYKHIWVVREWLLDPTVRSETNYMSLNICIGTNEQVWSYFEQTEYTLGCANHSVNSVYLFTLLS